jgi:chitinase
MPNIIYKNPKNKRAIYFFTQWSIYARSFNISDIPDTVTDIYYSFFDVEATGNIVSRDTYADTEKRFTDSGLLPYDSWNDDNKGIYGNFGQFIKLQKNRNVNIGLALFGWTYSKYISSAISTVNNRKNMINCIINYFKKYTFFNSISLDYEYPSNDGKNYGNDGNEARPEDSVNFLLLVQELRKSLDYNGFDKYQITICCVAAPEKVKFNVIDFVPYIDLFLIMTYDFAGFSGETLCISHTNPLQSSLSKYSCKQAIDYYISLGVPSNKLCLGGAFYSRGFTDSDGFNKKGNGLSSDISWEQGVVDYKDLPKTGAIEYFDNESKSAYSYDSNKRILNTYDNVQSILEKIKIINQQNLAGIIIWEISGDYKDYHHPRNLTRTIAENLTHNSLIQPSTPNPTPIPIPILIPTPKPNTNPTPIPAPNPTPVSIHVPKPNPTPVSIPTPIPIQIPAPNPNPTPVSIHVQKPNPTPVSIHVPKPNPTPVSIPTPIPIQIPAPIPIQIPVPMLTPNISESYRINIMYKKNDIVKYNNIKYTCLIDHISVDTLATRALWSVYNSIQFWNNSGIYKKNDIVSFNNSNYICLLDHTVSDKGWTPQAVPALWKVVN